VVESQGDSATLQEEESGSKIQQENQYSEEFDEKAPVMQDDENSEIEAKFSKQASQEWYTDRDAESDDDDYKSREMLVVAQIESQDKDQSPLKSSDMELPEEEIRRLVGSQMSEEEIESVHDLKYSNVKITQE
jgi:hypothetical protein